MYVQDASLHVTFVCLEPVHNCKVQTQCSAVLVWCAEQDRLEVRRETNEQDKHLDVISDALNDLQRIGEVRVGGHVPT